MRAAADSSNGMLFQASVDLLRTPKNSRFDLELARLLLSRLMGSSSRIEGTRHPLGFFHLDLSDFLPRNPESARLRLHYWPSPTVMVDDLGSLHEHDWALNSAVLSGVLTDVSYTPVEDPVGPFDGIQVRYGQVNRFEAVGRFRLREREVRTFRRQAVYRLPTGVVHQTKVETAPLVTLVLAVPHKDGSPPVVFVPHGRQFKGTAIRPKLTSDEVTSTLYDVSRLVQHVE